MAKPLAPPHSFRPEKKGDFLIYVGLIRPSIHYSFSQSLCQYRFGARPKSTTYWLALGWQSPWTVDQPDALVATRVGPDRITSDVNTPKLRPSSLGLFLADRGGCATRMNHCDGGRIAMCLLTLGVLAYCLGPSKAMSTKPSKRYR